MATNVSTKSNYALTLPLPSWPELDRELWEGSCVVFAIEEGSVCASSWAESRRRSIVEAVSLWLGFLDRHDKLDPDAHPAERPTKKLIRDFIGEARDRGCAGYTVAGYVWQIYSFLRAVSNPSAWGWLKEICVELWRTAVPKKNKRDLIVPTSRLIDTGLEYMEMAERRMAELAPGDLGGRNRCAIDFRDGFMIFLLAVRPLRLSNFSQIEIGHELSRAGSEYWLVFTPEQMKNRKMLEAPFPEVLLPALQQYQERYRPILLNGYRCKTCSTDRLWISSAGLPIRARTIYQQIVRKMHRKVGHPINPHLFRDCAATSIGNMAPEDASIIATILGHTTLDISEIYYNFSNRNAAIEQGIADFEALREPTRVVSN